MSEQRFIFYEYDDGTETIEDTEENEYYHFSNELVSVLNEQQDIINKLRKILAEAEDTIEVRLAEHYFREYENIKHNIIGDIDE